MDPLGRDGGGGGTSSPPDASVGVGRVPVGFSVTRDRLWPTHRPRGYRRPGTCLGRGPEYMWLVAFSALWAKEFSRCAIWPSLFDQPADVPVQAAPYLKHKPVEER